MKIELKKFGEMLISRPAGREAFLALSAYITRDLKASEPIEIDCSGVKVLTPSWADEVITKLADVQATLQTLREYSGLKI